MTALRRPLSPQVDALLSRLHILQERIGNTEHLVNLDLDAKRNALVAYTLGIDLILMAFELHMAVSGRAWAAAATNAACRQTSPALLWGWGRRSRRRCRSQEVLPPTPLLLPRRSRRFSE